MPLAAKTPPKGKVKGRVMVIDDEAAMGAILIKSLALEGLEALAYTNPIEALDAVGREQPDVIVTDVKMPQLSGEEVLERLRRDYPDIPVLIMTAYGTIEDAVAALKAGAFNYITKPFQNEHLARQIEVALEHRRLEQTSRRLADQDLRGLEARQIVGGSAGLERVREMIARAAQTDSAVLITGESGVGKELVAREIHRQSPRRNGRFVTVNCPAIPPGLIESEIFGYERGAFTGADRTKIGLIELSAGGSLFLDEIAELPVELQVKLLRVLQEREIQRLGGLRQIPVDLRVVAATNRRLDREIEAGNFRADLYYRLNVIPIHMPPLRERPEDIPELIEFFLEKTRRRLNRPDLKTDPALVAFLRTHPWPGNIRQLENTLERMAVMSPGSTLTLENLPTDLRFEETQSPVGDSPSAENKPRERWPQDYRKAREMFERSYLKQLLQSCDGNVTDAARISGISRRNLYEKFEKLKMNKDGEDQE